MDTLEITKKLEERPQAEAVAAAIGSASDQHLEDVRDRLERVDTQLDRVEDRLGKVEDRLGKVEVRIEALDHKIDARIATAQFQIIAWTVGALGVLFALMRLLP